jgi:hypothetical protein
VGSGTCVDLGLLPLPGSGWRVSLLRQRAMWRRQLRGGIHLHAYARTVHAVLRGVHGCAECMGEKPGQERSGHTAAACRRHSQLT